MLNPTKEQLADQKWWDENQPYHYPILIKDLGRKVYEWHAEINDRYVDQNCRFWLKSSSHHEVIARPVCQPEHAWRGPEDGLPPVGMECEYRLKEDDPYDWLRCRIEYKSDSGVVASCALPISGIIEQYLTPRCAEFRPTRTLEQLAADEREKAIEEIERILNGLYASVREAAEFVYDEGYRKLSRERLVELTKDEAMADAILAGYNVERGI